MLQVSRLQQVTEPTLPPESSSPAEVVTTFVQLVHRQFPVILIATLVTTILGVFYLLITPPSYTALATMLIDTKRPPLFQAATPSADISIESTIVASQVEILKSEKIALTVIHELQLYNDPEFVGPPRGLSGVVSGVFGGLSGNETPQTPEGACAGRLRHSRTA